METKTASDLTQVVNMTEHGKLTIGGELQEECDSNNFLKEYVEKHNSNSGEYPLLVDIDNVDDYESEYPNIIYKADDRKYVHVYGDVGNELTYHTVEPVFDDYSKYKEIVSKMHAISGDYNPPDEYTKKEKENHILKLYDNAVTRADDSSVNRFINTLRGLIELTNEEYERYQYSVRRNIAGLGEIDILMEDPNIEDIHIIGYDTVRVDHGAFGMIPTDIQYESSEAYKNWIGNIGERMNTQITDSNPIVDATLPNGSRINIMYSEDVSVKGPTVTIRQGDEVPLSILQITNWGTLSPRMAAYLWLCLENEQTVFVIGETASGKTTTLNSIMSFIPRDDKIYSAEDTTEVLPPHETWQQTKTRETTGESASDVEMTDLVESSLRARPSYIIVGEVRGEEAKQAFNAAQTGHPVMLTFHASDIESAIQRFTKDPMNVPKSNIENADVMLFQNRIKREEDNKILRRVTAVNEVVGYDGETDSIINKQAFKYDTATDEHIFSGLNNSHVLENNIAELLGYEDKTDIYDELDRRTKIIKRLIENNVLEYEEVNEAIETIQQDGVSKLDKIETRDLTK